MSTDPNYSHSEQVASNDNPSLSSNTMSGQYHDESPHGSRGSNSNSTKSPREGSHPLYSDMSRTLSAEESVAECRYYLQYVGGSLAASTQYPSGLLIEAIESGHQLPQNGQHSLVTESHEPQYALPNGTQPLYMEGVYDPDSAAASISPFHNEPANHHNPSNGRHDLTSMPTDLPSTSPQNISPQTNTVDDSQGHLSFTACVWLSQHSPEERLRLASPRWENQGQAEDYENEGRTWL